MGFSQGSSYVYSCAKTCPASPESSLTVGENVLSTLPSRIPPFISPAIGHLPVLGLKSLSSVSLTSIPPPKTTESPHQYVLRLNLREWATHPSVPGHSRFLAVESVLPPQTSLYCLLITLSPASSSTPLHGLLPYLPTLKQTKRKKKPLLLLLLSSFSLLSKFFKRLVSITLCWRLGSLEADAVCEERYRSGINTYERKGEEAGQGRGLR